MSEPSEKFSQAAHCPASLGLRLLAAGLDFFGLVIMCSALAATLLFKQHPDALAWMMQLVEQGPDALSQLQPDALDQLSEELREDILALFTKVSLLSLGVMLGYFTLCEWLWKGRTLGKAFVRLRAVRHGTGQPLLFGQALLRNLIKVFSFFFIQTLPSPLGFLGLADPLAVFFSAERLSLHDRLGRTIVIDETRCIPSEEPSNDAS